MLSMGLLLGQPEMGVVVVRADRSGVELEVRAEERLRVPNWFGEAVLLGQYWLASGLVGYLEEEVRVVRGRMGRYEVMDFVLLLVSYAISGERTIADFYRSLFAGEGSIDEPVGARELSISIEPQSVSWVCGSKRCRGIAKPI